VPAGTSLPARWNLPAASPCQSRMTSRKTLRNPGNTHGWAPHRHLRGVSPVRRAGHPARPWRGAVPKASPPSATALHTFGVDSRPLGHVGDAVSCARWAAGGRPVRVDGRPSRVRIAHLVPKEIPLPGTAQSPVVAAPVVQLVIPARCRGRLAVRCGRHPQTVRRPGLGSPPAVPAPPSGHARATGSPDAAPGAKGAYGLRATPARNECSIRDSGFSLGPLGHHSCSLTRPGSTSSSPSR
jgi:hypothetical protein